VVPIIAFFTTFVKIFDDLEVCENTELEAPDLHEEKDTFDTDLISLGAIEPLSDPLPFPEPALPASEGLSEFCFAPVSTFKGLAHFLGPFPSDQVFTTSFSFTVGKAVPGGEGDLSLAWAKPILSSPSGYFTCTAPGEKLSGAANEARNLGNGVIRGLGDTGGFFSASNGMSAAGGDRIIISGPLLGFTFGFEEFPFGVYASPCICSTDVAKAAAQNVR
jgi:hypothetical protein